MPFADLKSQYKKHKQVIDDAIQTVINDARFIMGPAVSQLERCLETYIGSPHAIACASGTDALQLALMAIDIQPGDEIITTPFTFIATGEIIALLKAVPVFVDIDPVTFNIDTNKIAEKITNKTKAIVPVSLYGQPADMIEINKIAAECSKKVGHEIFVIEDAAQSFGSEYNGKKSCNLSKLATTSFFPAKPLGCYGDGGAVFTTDAKLAEKISSLRVHGQTKRYHHEYIGINGRMDTVQAAILNAKLAFYPQELATRQMVASRYTALFKSTDLDIRLPNIGQDRTSAFAQYTLRVNNRDELKQYLSDQGIPAAVHYPIPLHLQPCFRSLGFNKGDFPESERAAKEVISLPMCAFLTDENQDRVVNTIKKYCYMEV